MQKCTINYFEIFLIRNDADKLFKSFYEEYRFPDNPETCEKWFINAGAMYVIILAFDFNKLANDPRFDRAFWKRLHFKWIHNLSEWSKGNMQIAENLIEQNLSNLQERVNAEQHEEKPRKNNQEWFSDFLIPLATGKPVLSTTPSGRMVRFTCGKGLFVFSPEISKELANIEEPKMSLFVDRESSELCMRFSKNDMHNVRTGYSTELYAVQSRSFTDIIARYLNTTSMEGVNIYIKTGRVRWSGDKTACILKITNKYEIR